MWYDNAYGSILWGAAAAAHDAHRHRLGRPVVLWLLMRTPHGESPRRIVDTDENALYWRFVWLAWIPIYSADLLGAEDVPVKHTRRGGGSSSRGPASSPPFSQRGSHTSSGPKACSTIASGSVPARCRSSPLFAFSVHWSADGCPFPSCAKAKAARGG